MLFDVPDPVLDVVKTLLIGNIVDEHDAHGPAVVGCGDGSEPLLSRRVPYREVAPRPADVDLLVQEGRLKGGSKVKETFGYNNMFSSFEI